MHAQRRVIVVGRSVCRSVRTFFLSVAAVDTKRGYVGIMYVHATGARHSKSLERHCARTACLRWGLKIMYSYYTRCALIRDHQPTAWDGLFCISSSAAETEATCVWKVSHQIVVERFLKVCIMSVKYSGRESSDAVVRLKILWTIDSYVYTKHCGARTTT